MFSKYQNIVISNSHEKPTPSEILDLEEKLEAKLPSSFIEFLNVANGATVTGYYINFQIGSNISLTNIESIFTTKDILRPNFGFMIDFLRESYISLPKQILPFAIGSDETYFFLDLRNPAVAPVVLLKAGRPEWTGKKPQDLLITLVEKFDDFTNLWQLKLDQYEEELTYALKHNDTSLSEEIVQFLELALPNWELRIRPVNTMND